MTNISEQTDKLILELRRGIIVLATLSQLDERQYGYSLIQSLSERGLDIEEGTLYPLLRRLEKQGLLASEWQVGDSSRPRRYYTLSPAGQEVLTTLTTEWHDMVQVVDHLLDTTQGA